MRRVAALLLTLTVSCTTDYTGLDNEVLGGTGIPSGSGGWANVGGGGAAVGGAAGMAATGGMVATGGMDTGGMVATGGAGAGGAGSQAGAGGQPSCCEAGGAGGAAMTLKALGTTCGAGVECVSGYCVDGVCCDSACTGTCRTCAGRPGTCTAAVEMSDPRGDCPANPPCGAAGYCNGAGACALAPAGKVCDATPSCDSTNTAVVMGAVCNGAGACVPNLTESCNGFVCASGACETGCSDDSACAPGGFCSAGTCVVVPNLAGNGDLETGTLTGWSSLTNEGTLALSSPATGGYAHAGQFSAELSGRSLFYQGPAYVLPTGLGRYLISVWALQTEETQDLPSELVVQIMLTCTGTYPHYLTVQMAGVGMSVPAGTWAQFTATVDMNLDIDVGPDCYPDGLGATPGEVKSAVLWLNQLQANQQSSSADADLYLDDLTVESVDGHNLVGNPTFEAGLTDGWTTVGDPSMLGVSSTVAHGGRDSLWQQGRTAPDSAIAYALPIGAARYAVSLWVEQSGTTPHQIGLLPMYSCIGSPTVYFAAPPTPVTAPPDQWTQLTGTFVFPPANAPAGCVLSQAMVALGQAETGACADLECPDLFVDDASITLK